MFCCHESAYYLHDVPEFGDEDYFEERYQEREPDPQQIEAKETLRGFFNARCDSVFFSRQIEVLHENRYFHWITNRALRELEGEGFLRSERRPLSFGGSIKVMWHRSNRYYRREAQNVIRLVEEYSEPSLCEAIGLQGEALVSGAFAGCQFVQLGRNTSVFRGKQWRSQKDLDFVWRRDGVLYGAEVKNMLGYMDYREFMEKRRMCEFFGIRPIFVARMLPKTWINELNKAGGYAMILKYQLYPWGYRELAKRVATELSLPVDSPRALADGTMQRFLKWHEKNKRKV